MNLPRIVGVATARVKNFCGELRGRGASENTPRVCRNSRSGRVAALRFVAVQPPVAIVGRDKTSRLGSTLEI